MKLDASLSLREDAQITIGANGTIGLWVSRVGIHVPIDPEALYLLALLSLGGTVGAAMDRGGFEDDDSFHNMLELLITNRIVGEGLKHIPEQHPRHASAVGDDQPIFVLGHHRSGTTLMRWILDSHPRICCASDTHFLTPVKNAFWGGSSHSVQQLTRLGVSEDRVKALVIEFVQSVYRNIATKNGKVRWADKTNAYVMYADFLSWLFDGRCRFIVVVRHGLDVASSDFFRWTPWPEGGESITASAVASGLPLEAQLRSWSDVNAYLHRFTIRNAERCLCVRYEDLVRDPARLIDEVFRFVGESVSPDLLERVFAHNHDPANVGPVFEDYKIRSTSRIETDRIERWRQWPPELLASIANMVNPVLQLWGYPAVEAAAVPGVLASQSPEMTATS